MPMPEIGILRHAVNGVLHSCRTRVGASGRAVLRKKGP